MMCPERLTPTQGPSDDDLIDQALQRAHERESVISDAAARVIASQLHGGQASALYNLASSGAIDREGLEAELRLDAQEFKEDSRALGQLEALARYIDSRGDHIEPREGWNELWLKEETQIAGRTADEWHKFLTTHNGEPSGHLEAPGSRYGRDADACAWYAVALLALYEASGADSQDAEAIIDFAMGLVVNDNEDVALMILEHSHDVPQEVMEHLDIAELNGSGETE